MNIREHIEAGHYPSDAKGRALVPASDGKTYTIICTDKPGTSDTVGFDAEGYTKPFDLRAPHSNIVRLLPPPPRKVEVKRFGVIRLQKCGPLFHTTADTVDTARALFPANEKCVIVELTGSYEEPCIK